MKPSTFSLLTVLSLAFAPALRAEEGWKSMFNGKDLSGWKSNAATEDKADEKNTGAFGTLGRLYGANARSAITGITLFGGFASTVGWPIMALLDGELGWRATCFIMAAVLLVLFAFSQSVAYFYLPADLAKTPVSPGTLIRLGEPVTPGARMVLTVHDELVFEVPVAEVAEAKKRVTEAMETVWKLRVPLEVDAGSGLNWGDIA